MSQQRTHYEAEYNLAVARMVAEQGITAISLNPDTVIETWLYLAQAEKK